MVEPLAYEGAEDVGSRVYRWQLWFGWTLETHLVFAERQLEQDRRSCFVLCMDA